MQKRYAALIVVLIACLVGCGTATSSNQAATVSSITLSPTSLSLTPGQSQQVTATANYSNGTSASITSALTWSSGTSSIATVGNGSTAGVVTGVAQGTATITATYSPNGVSATLSVTVNAGSSTLSSISITPSQSTIAISTSEQLTATGSFSTGTANITDSVNWTSSNPDAITVNASTGVVQAVALGNAVITATDPTTNITGTLNLTVSSATLSSLNVTPQGPSVQNGLTVQLDAQGVYSNNTTQDLTEFVNWTSENTTVATVSSLGLVTASSVGTATIQATDPVSGKTATTLVTVTSSSSSP